MIVSRHFKVSDFNHFYRRSLIMVEEANSQELAKKERLIDAESKEATTQGSNEAGTDVRIPQDAMLTKNDLQNIHALMDRIEMKGSKEAKIVVNICAKIETILRAEAVAQKAAEALKNELKK